MERLGLKKKVGFWLLVMVLIFLLIQWKQGLHFCSNFKSVDFGM